MVWNELFTSSIESDEIILVGEVLVDVIFSKSNSQTYVIVGGSPYNIAKNLTKLGVKNKFFGAIGNDEYGRLITEDIEKHRIKAKINRTNNFTSYVELNQTNHSPNPSFFRDADSVINFDTISRRDIKHLKILHFTYWPLTKEPSLSTIRSLVLKAQERNALIGFDPNYHESLDENHHGLEIIKRLINIADIIKPSLDDSKRLFGEMTITEYLDEYESLGAKLIIMTLGKDGLIARYKGETLTLPSKATTVIDATGAGDAFWSGLYAGILSNLTIRNAIDLGLECSAISLKSIGSDIDLPNINELIK